MHYYQFNIGDYASHTGHLDETEDLIFRRLIDLYYLHESPFPDDVDQLARLICMRTHCERIAVVLREFFKLQNGFWYLPRADREIEKFYAKSEKARESAKARWGKNVDSEQIDADADAMRTHSERNATHNTIHNTQDTIDRATPTRSKPNGKFKPPTLSEVREYCQEKNLQVDCQDFIDFYESKNWMVGKNKMKDWAAALRRATKWEKNQKQTDSLEDYTKGAI